jgi:hypothetical protein
MVPLATTGVPLLLVDSWYVPVMGDCALLFIASPPAVIFVNAPCAAEKLTPDNPLVLVMLIQKPAPTPVADGENQLPGVAVPPPGEVMPFPLNTTDCATITSPTAVGFATYGVNGLPCHIGV